MANSLVNGPPPSSPAPSPPRVREEEVTPTEIHSVSAPPRKRGSMLNAAGEGTSEDRAKRPNVEPPAPAPAPAPEPPVSERTCYSCEIAFDTMTSFAIHMQSHQEMALYVPDWDEDSDWSPRSPPYEPVTSPGENSSDLSVNDEFAAADAAVAAAPMEPVYLLPDLNLPAPEEEDEEDDEDDEE
ncbi:hypothetical protein KY285_013167 [Solanum tuberosum]|nr:hypothetical protein KY285_013167 [Solanum tuberosum]